MKNPEMPHMASGDNSYNKKHTPMWCQQKEGVMRTLKGFEAMAGVQNIHLKELVEKEPLKKGA